MNTLPLAEHRNYLIYETQTDYGLGPSRFSVCDRGMAQVIGAPRAFATTAEAQLWLDIFYENGNDVARATAIWTAAKALGVTR